MSTTGFFQFMRGNKALRRHRTAIRERIQNEPAIRFLPALIDLPLLPEHSLDAVVGQLRIQPAALGLYGPIGGGRSLALLQIAWHWIDDHQSAPVLHLPLAQLDARNLSPRAILAGKIHACGLPDPANLTESAQKAWLLLVDQWEELPADRREAWQDFLLDLRHTWPEARLTLALPNALPRWPDILTVTMAKPSEEQIARWLEHILPDDSLTPLLDALAPHGQLAPLRDRLRDIVLLAWVYHNGELPTSPLKLYDTAATLLENAAAPGEDAQPTPPIIGDSALRAYEQARQIAASGNLATLLQLHNNERTDVARLLAELLPNPAPLFATLWQDVKASPAQLLVLSDCLRVRPDVDPQWSLRTLHALVDQANKPRYRARLDMLIPTLPAILEHSTQQSDDVRDQDIAALLQRIAPMIGATSLIAIGEKPALPSRLRWAAAASLASLPEPDRPNTLPQSSQSTPPDPLAQTLRIYIAALAGSTSCQRLADVDPAWCDVLLSPQVSQKRRSEVAAALLNDAAVPLADRIRALRLLPSNPSDDLLQLLMRISVEAEPTLRNAATHILRQHDPRQSLHFLSRTLLESAEDWAVQRFALEQVGAYKHGESSALLARCTIAPNIPLVGRIHAVELLAARPNVGPLLLRRIVRAERTHPAVRAAAARRLGQMPDAGKEAIAVLIQTATGDASTLVRQAAIQALGTIGSRGEGVAEALTTLHAALSSAAGNSEIIAAAAQALGRIGADESVPALRALLSTDTTAYLRSIWLERNPQLASQPASQWSDVDLSDEHRTALMTLLSDGQTPADAPSTLDELVVYEANLVRIAAAETLADIANHADNADHTGQHPAYNALLHTIRAEFPPKIIHHLLECLKRASSDNGLSAVENLLSDSGLDPILRWQVIERLGQNPNAASFLLHYLERYPDDPFISSKLVHALGRQHTTQALPILRQLATRPDGNPHLRTQAINALGQLESPEIQETLLDITATAYTPAALRGLAAEMLPKDLSSAACRTLRNLLGGERQPPELAAGVLHALGRARDRAALPLMLRYLHSDQTIDAIAALDAIADLGDASITPELVRVTQRNAVGPNVRLRAVGALLRIGGDEYIPLLRNYIDHAMLPMRMQALDYLLEIRPHDPRPLVLAADRTVPLALRLRSLAALERRTEAREVIARIAADTSDEPQIRLQATALLSNMSGPSIVTTLVQCIRETDNPPLLRRCCVNTLAERTDKSNPDAIDAQNALSKIADDPAQPAENRVWAARALLQQE